MSPRDKKVLLISAAVLCGSYIFHGLVTSAMQIAFYRPAPRPARPKQNSLPAPEAKPSTPPARPASVLVNTTPKPSNLAGIWSGSLAMDGRGYCNFRLEIQQKDSEHYSGYSTFRCINNGLTPKDRKALIMNVNPDSAILSGTSDNGVIRFNIDKNIGTDIRGCAISALTITPFNNQLAAEWEYGSCPGGHVLLQKVHR